MVIFIGTSWVRTLTYLSGGHNSTRKSQNSVSCIVAPSCNYSQHGACFALERERAGRVREIDSKMEANRLFGTQFNTSARFCLLEPVDKSSPDSKGKDYIRLYGRGKDHGGLSSRLPSIIYVLFFLFPLLPYVKGSTLYLTLLFSGTSI